MLDKLKFIISILPSLMSIIKLLEAEVPMSDNGKAKIELLKGILEKTIENVNSNWGLIESITGLIVNFYNATGIFKKS